MTEKLAIQPPSPVNPSGSGHLNLSRRSFLRSLGAVGASIPLAALIAACGGDDNSATVQPSATSAESPATVPTGITGSSVDVDLDAVKTFALEQAESMKQGTEDLVAAAEDYYHLVSENDFDYLAAYEANQLEMVDLIVSGRESWVTASTYYETNEGIVAGVPSLAEFDVWIDAGPSGEEDPLESRDWQLELPNGDVLDRPGNIFHGLLEPVLWGTKESSVGAYLDEEKMDEQSTIAILPEANLYVAAAEALNDATAEMIVAIIAWEPTLSDVFTAEVTMIPTMNEYFEQWKNSIYVSGVDEAEETAFVGVSRLFDINGILTGLDTAYREMSVAVAAADPDLDALISQGFEDLLAFVGDLFEQEQNGVQFSGEEADLLGSEAQDQATALAGHVTQAAALLNVELAG